jgi:hypothetical protein
MRPPVLARCGAPPAAIFPIADIVPSFSFLKVPLKGAILTQKQINRAVALATGESLPEIRRRGFSLADPGKVHFDPEPRNREPQTIDWDELDSGRISLFP